MDEQVHTQTQTVCIWAKEAFKAFQSQSHDLVSVSSVEQVQQVGHCNEGNLLQPPDYGLKVSSSFYFICFVFICSDKCPCLPWLLRNLVLVTPHGPSGCFRGLDGSSMERCIPLSVQYPLLSGWELGWSFGALQTQPFMSHFHSQTTTMTLPSSSPPPSPPLPPALTLCLPSYA